jgi:tetratricopeptide (TPR) repeat protein
MMINKSSVLFGLIIILNGCAESPEKPVATVPVEDRSVPVEIGADTTRHEARVESTKQEQIIPKAEEYDSQYQNIKTHASGPAVIALLTEADRYAKAGRGDQAAASLERALRIEPRNAMLWHRLSVIRLQQGQWDQAITLARKSNTLSGQDYKLQSGNWEVIARGYEALGQGEKAKKAWDRARNLVGKG